MKDSDETLIGKLTDDQRIALMVLPAWLEERGYNFSAAAVVVAIDELSRLSARVAELEGELERSTNHLACYRESYPMDSTPDIDASIYCARSLLKKETANG